MPRFPAYVVPLCLVAVAGCGGDDEPAAPERTAAPQSSTGVADETVVVRLRQEHGSGRSGTAKLVGGEDGVTVTLTLKRPGDAAPAHIHDVTCEEYRATKGFEAQLATVDTPLEDLQSGRSTTPVGTPLPEFRTGGFSINVHSTKGGFPVVACGDIPTG